MLTLRDIELLDELQHTENSYRTGLAKLMASCSPLRGPAAEPSATQTTQIASSTRRLVAHHQTLAQILASEEFEESYTPLVAWLERGVAVYAHYIANYTYDRDTLPVELQLRKLPLQRLTQLHKTAQKLDLVPESTVNQYERLVDRARDTVEQQNLRVDLNTVHFDAVKELDDELSSTVAYFKLSDVVERDYFEFELIHPKESQPERLIEVFTLKNGCIALCLVQSVGRSLLHPPFRVDDFSLNQNDSECVVLTRDAVEIRLRCPDHRQMAHWNQTFTHLSHQQSTYFMDRHAKLAHLKGGMVGLGFHSTQDTIGSTLRKSSPMLAKHNSLIRNGSQLSQNLSNVNHYFSATDKDLHKINSYTDQEPAALTHLATPEIKSTESPHLEKLEDLADFAAAIEATLSPEPLRSPLSPVQPLNIKKHLEQNDSMVSLPNFKHSGGSVQLNKTFAQSVGDLSKPSAPSHKSSNSSLNSTTTQKKEKMKRRKSLFGLFAKKNDEPAFEIVTKASIPSTTTITKSASSTSAASTGKPVSSMASLHRSVQNLNISDKRSSFLPSPFTTTATPSTSKARELTPLEHDILSSSSTSQVITNSCIVSRWAQNKWQSIGKQYHNELRFLHNTSHSTLTVFTDLGSEVPDLFIHLNNPHTTITKSSALDLQIRCPQSLDSTHIHILTLRCCDSKTSGLILEEFAMAQGKYREDGSGNSTRETISNSSTVLFDKPSNSTSMSSISLLEDSWAPPKAMYGVPMHSNSTLSFNSFKSAETTQNQPGIGELLLKNNVKVRLHKQDGDGDWIPLSMGKFSISSSITNPDYSRFQVKLANGNEIESLVKNSLCSRLGKSGLKFASIGEEGEELNYLLEFKDEKECKDIHELLI